MSKKKKTFKVHFATYARNGGDGSVIVQFFPNVLAAEKVADKDDEDFGERYCEDVNYHELEFDEDGNLLDDERAK